MIPVDRTRVSPPPGFESWRAGGIAELEAFFQLPRSERIQRRPPFTRYPGKDLVPALHQLFQGKCGYCETPVAKAPHLERFRPRQRSSDLAGEIAPEHYAWLAYEWDNLVLTCTECRRYKGSLFPVAGKRAGVWVRGADLEREKPLLVDPGRQDVGSHFFFELDGTVRGRTAMGRTTIEVLHLNRPRLVTARNRAAVEVVRAFRDHPQASKKQRRDALAAAAKLSADDLPYAAVRKAQFDQLALEMAEGEVLSPKHVGEAPVQPPFWSEDYGAAVWLERVEIENFRVLHQVALAFPEPQADDDGELQEPWIMLLGENGVGKSSILKAVALALASPALRRRLAPNAGELFNRRVKRGKAVIRLFFSGSDQPFEVTFGKRDEEFKTSGVAPRMPTLAYGSTRLLPPASRAKTRPRARRVRIDNLFDPRAPLAEAEPWLTDTSRVSSERFNLLATSLKDLLSLGEEERLYRRGGAVSARLGEARVSIREFSDGYQSLFALATDLMLNMSRESFDMESVAGLVLLDEIEVHLHPQWKIEVVGTLRKLFPRVRFLATTHDPLCLHGLEDGEVHVLERDPETQRVEVRQVNVPPGLRADQLLTGFWFGLSSTRDDATLELMRRHGELILLESPSADERRERQRIERELDERLHGFDRQELEAETEVRARTPVQRPRTKADKQALRAKILGRRRTQRGDA